MICRCPTNAGDSKLLVRASATILVFAKAQAWKPQLGRVCAQLGKALFDVDVTREFPEHRILAHHDSNIGKIVFVEKSCFSLGISKIS